MKDKRIIEQVADTIRNSHNTPTTNTAKAAPLSDNQKNALMDAIDQLFAEFELTYHNQYLKAFPTAEKLGYAKKLWFDYLKEFTPERIIRACRKATRESDYLPTIHTLIKHCEVSDNELGLPDAHQAYIEACQAPTPKTDYAWSHPAVYWAGKTSDWFFLSNNIESKALPVFKRNYEIICERVKQGEQLSPPIAIGLPNKNKQTQSSEERQAHIKKVREQVNL